MTRLLFTALGLPLLLAGGPAPADSPTVVYQPLPGAPAPAVGPSVTYQPLAPDIQFTPAPPAYVPYTLAPPGVLMQPAPAAPLHELPMVIISVDPSKYPIVMSQGVPGHYPMVIVPAPGGQMDAPLTTIPYLYQTPQGLALSSTAQPLKLLITPPNPAK